MKTYTDTEITWNGHTSARYVALADLIEAGVLVPVATNEPLYLSNLDKLPIDKHTNTVRVPSSEWRIYAAERRIDKSGHRYLMPVSDQFPPVAMAGNTFVEPVRLLAIQEVVEYE